MYNNGNTDVIFDVTGYSTRCDGLSGGGIAPASDQVDFDHREERRVAQLVRDVTRAAEVVVGTGRK